MDTKIIKKGMLLISEPFLGDEHFERSVVLICEHNAQGSFGFVLNQKTNSSLREAWNEVSFV
jgi:putative transcriptional regulator